MTTLTQSPAWTLPTLRIETAVAGVRDRVGDRLGMPNGDVGLLAMAITVVALLFAISLAATTSPGPGPMRQLELQHQEWVAQQAMQGPSVIVVP